MSENYDSKTRVNGTLLHQYNGRGVVVLGRIERVDPNSTSLSLRTSDDKEVNVIFDQPIMEHLDGILEVHGICHGKQVRCQSYYMLPIDTCENFDMKSYDEAVQLIHSTENCWRVD